jgi:signal transduction histidine kinase
MKNEMSRWPQKSQPALSLQRLFTKNQHPWISAGIRQVKHLARSVVGTSTNSSQPYSTPEELSLYGVSENNEMNHDRQRSETSPSKREQFLELLNGLTHTTLLSNDWHATFHALACDIRGLIGADDCYILGWDEERQWSIPITTTAKLDFSFSESTFGRDELDLVMSVLREQRVLAIEDALNSSYIGVKIAAQFPSRSGIAVPLIAGDHRLGAVIVGYSTLRQFTPEEIERAKQAGNQIALALWTFQQSLELQQRLKESSALAKIEQSLSETERVGTGEILQLIVDSARELMPHAQKSVLHLLEGDEQILVARAVSGFNKSERELKSMRMRLGEGIAGQAMLEGVTINVKDVETDPLFLQSESPTMFQSLIVAPVQSRGRPIGTISVQSTVKNAFSSRDADLLNALAVQSAIAIENTRLFETTQQRLKEVNILYQISRSLAASLNADQLIRDMIGLLQQSFNYYHVQIYLVDPETRSLVVQHGSGYIGNELVKKGHQISAGEGIVGHVAQTGEPFMSNNVDEVIFYKRYPLLPQIQSELAVPIRVDEQVIGVLDIEQTINHNPFTSNDLYLVTAIAEHLAVVLQKANLYSTLQTSLQEEKNVRSQLLQSERLALIGRLLASVSHELNNPLQTIQYGLFVLRDEVDLSSQTRRDLEIMIGEAERMAALIERLRSTYRPVHPQEFQTIALNDLIEDVHALICAHLRQNDIAFEFIPEPNLPNVLGLPDQIRQVMLNLFLNAIEAMKPGGCLTVETYFEPQQQNVLLVVKDTGPGIDPEIMTRIFDAFITSKETGTGLGLTITRDIIQQHHGSIEAENDPQGESGAIFKIWLPMEERLQI